MEARFPGHCEACSGHIHVGDEIEPDAEGWGWIHQRCHNTPGSTQDKRLRCLVCADLIVDGACQNCGKVSE